ncbi:uncharacterized protein [Amphiura filiformis]|uniref:uncharacterized protein n=1 Tax=Amphiura filiformis TaxID=82378 RepID=UPI003B219832
MADRVLSNYFLVGILSICVILSAGQKEIQACFKDPTMVRDIRNPATAFYITWIWKPITTSQATCEMYGPDYQYASNVTVKYALTNRDNCEEIRHENMTVFDKEGSAESVTVELDELDPYHAYSTYTIYFDISSEGKVRHITQWEIETDEGKPGKPQNVNATFKNETIVFEWDGPPCGQRRANITSYGITLYKSDSPDKKIENQTDDRTYKFQDLSPDTAYTFTVQSEASLSSDPVSFNVTTDPVRPVQVTTQTYTSLTVQSEADLSRSDPVKVDATTIWGTDLVRSTFQATAQAGDQSQATLLSDPDENGRPTTIWFIMAGTAGGVVVISMIIIIIVHVIMLCKTKKRPSNDIDTLPLHEYGNIRAGSTGPLGWEIQRENFKILDKILGEGSFGVVQEGEVRIGNSWITVAVKSLPDGAGETEVKGFENELAIMKKIGRHINIVSLVGACRFEGMLYVALEHVTLGNLKKFLKESRISNRNYENVDFVTNLSHAQLISLALDVAKGMQHLADREIIHRDLAARNILVGQSFDGLVAKVCDFGMSRGDSIYRQSSNARVPVKWTAIESLTRQIFTTKSDVWSFGILLWEIVTLGGTPYTNPKIENRDLPLYLQNNHRLAKPQNCDEMMYDLMFRCWAGRPADRPTFAQLVRELTNILDDEGVYVLTSIRGVDNFRFVNIYPDDD